MLNCNSWHECYTISNTSTGTAWITSCEFLWSQLHCKLFTILRKYLHAIHVQPFLNLMIITIKHTSQNTKTQKNYEIYTVSQKRRHYTLVHIFAKYWPIFTILSPTYSVGTVATHLRWGGIFINNFIAQFQLSTSVKELWKSLNI